MLCCKYNNRIYKGGNNDIDLDGKVMKLSSENKIVVQKNDELREKNHKLKQKLQREKDKRKSGNKISVNLDSLSAKNFNFCKITFFFCLVFPWFICWFWSTS